MRPAVENIHLKLSGFREPENPHWLQATAMKKFPFARKCLEVSGKYLVGPEEREQWQRGGKVIMATAVNAVSAKFQAHHIPTLALVVTSMPVAKKYPDTSRSRHLFGAYVNTD